MANFANISCINKEPRYDPYHRITHVGGINPDGTRWKLSLQEAIDYLNSGNWEFWTQPEVGHGQKVGVAYRNGHSFLKTVADYDTPDNLLSLRECP